MSLFTTVFLRNQNRVPTASFTAVRDGTSIVLNGSDSGIRRNGRSTTSGTTTRTPAAAPDDCSASAGHRLRLQPTGPGNYSV